MKRILLFLGLVLVLAPVWAGSVEEKGESDVFLEKSKELTSGGKSRVDKLITLHTFVRDEMSECTTKFG